MNLRIGLALAQAPGESETAPEQVAASHRAAVEETRRRGAELKAMG